MLSRGFALPTGTIDHWGPTLAACYPETRLLFLLGLLLFSMSVGKPQESKCLLSNLCGNFILRRS